MSLSVLAFQAVGAFAATFLLSRFFFLWLRPWDGGARRVITAHTMSLVLALFVSTRLGEFDQAHAIVLYGIGQIVWFSHDLWRGLRRRRFSAKAVTAAHDENAVPVCEPCLSAKEDISIEPAELAPAENW